MSKILVRILICLYLIFLCSFTFTAISPSLVRATSSWINENANYITIDNGQFTAILKKSGGGKFGSIVNLTICGDSGNILVPTGHTGSPMHELQNATNPDDKTPFYQQTYNASDSPTGGGIRSGTEEVTINVQKEDYAVFGFQFDMGTANISVVRVHVIYTFYKALPYFLVTSYEKLLITSYCSQHQICIVVDRFWSSDYYAFNQIDGSTIHWTRDPTNYQGESGYAFTWQHSDKKTFAWFVLRNSTNNENLGMVIVDSSNEPKTGYEISFSAYTSTFPYSEYQIFLTYGQTGTGGGMHQLEGQEDFVSYVLHPYIGDYHDTETLAKNLFSNLTSSDVAFEPFIGVTRSEGRLFAPYFFNNYLYVHHERSNQEMIKRGALCWWAIPLYNNDTGCYEPQWELAVESIIRLHNITVTDRKDSQFRFEWNRTRTVFDDSDKLVLKFTITAKQNVNVTMLRVMSHLGDLTLKKLNDTCADWHFKDYDGNDFGYCEYIINAQDVTFNEAGRRIDVYLAKYSPQQEFPAGTKWTGEIWVQSHFGNWTTMNDIEHKVLHENGLKYYNSSWIKTPSLMFAVPHLYDGEKSLWASVFSDNKLTLYVNGSGTQQFNLYSAKGIPSKITNADLKYAFPNGTIVLQTIFSSPKEITLDYSVPYISSLTAATLTSLTFSNQRLTATITAPSENEIGLGFYSKYKPLLVVSDDVTLKPNIDWLLNETAKTTTIRVKGRGSVTVMVYFVVPVTASASMELAKLSENESACVNLTIESNYTFPANVTAMVKDSEGEIVERLNFTFLSLIGFQQHRIALGIYGPGDYKVDIAVVDATNDILIYSESLSFSVSTISTMLTWPQQFGMWLVAITCIIIGVITVHLYSRQHNTGGKPKR